MDELLEKYVITLGLLILSRLGMFIPLPGIDYESFYSINRYNSALQNVITFSGHGLTFVGLFALGIVPHINASIFIQLVANLIPFLQNLQKEEGECGRRKLAQITRHLALVLAIIQSFGLSLWLKTYAIKPGSAFILGTCLSLSAGFMLNLWISEQITEKGIGDGPSLLIFVGIVSHVPRLLQHEVIPYVKNTNILKNITLGFLFLTMMAGVAIIHEGTNKILLISSKQLTKNKINTSANHIPFKVNHAGVTPIVLASTSLNLITSLCRSTNNRFMWLLTNFMPLVTFQKIISIVVYFLLVVGFSYSHGLLIVKPDEISKNLQKMETSIQGVRPGKDTTFFLRTKLQNFILLGSILLACIACMPLIIEITLETTMFRTFGPASLLISTGIILQTREQIRALLHSKNYSELMN
ncbi:preprotein translocase subunit SecY (plastid) [Cryptomonas paramecium]|uniref:Preprotein translocase subunit SecY n=1 Tax=Cryptomonas paramaecium TaxID=2898 RepID=D2ISB1_9CRYP|nr:preprotein translocase subunit SecY [Cryptomonas paramecium]ACT46803.1 preprotein translocase subunit SecY [Cryptomonas paramecium]BDA97992.1 preprotein translocase subunit SecY [Cryptomonas paramecium]